MNDFLKTKREEIASRLGELAPLVEEYRQLEAAAAALAAIPAATSTGTRRRASGPRQPPAPARSRSRARAAGARGRPRGSGTRALQALEIVKTKPGITIPEIAAAMGIKQNYLYRVLPSLQKDGTVIKRGRGWHATDQAASAKAASAG